MASIPQIIEYHHTRIVAIRIRTFDVQIIEIGVRGARHCEHIRVRRLGYGVNGVRLIHGHRQGAQLTRQRSLAHREKHDEGCHNGAQHDADGNQDNLQHFNVGLTDVGDARRRRHVQQIDADLEQGGFDLAYEEDIVGAPEMRKVGE